MQHRWKRFLSAGGNGPERVARILLRAGEASLLNGPFREVAGNDICQEPEYCIWPLTSH
jgi:hypothetical protein